MACVKSQQSGVRKDPPALHELEPENDSFTLAHLSDFHLSSPGRLRVREIINKRALGVVSWMLRRRSEHRPEVLSALLRDLKSVNPDHVAVTGDLTHLGLPVEFEMARQWLSAMGPPSRVTVIPGNHDAYVRDEWNRTFALWEDYMRSDATSAALFPTLRVRWRAALIGVSTARPSAPLLAVGRIGHRQLQHLEEILAVTGRQGLFRVVLIHHPPLPDVVTWHKRLTDGAAFRSVLARQGAELILHGHGHRTSRRSLETPAGRAVAVGVPSASAIGFKPARRARYHLYRLSRNAAGWGLSLAVRGYSPVEDRFKEEGEQQLLPTF